MAVHTEDELIETERVIREIEKSGSPTPLMEAARLMLIRDRDHALARLEGRDDQ